MSKNQEVRKEVSFEVYQDNADGIYFFTLDQEGKAVYAATDYQFREQGVLMNEDIPTFLKDGTTEDWHTEDHDPQKIYDELQEPYASHLIATGKAGQETYAIYPGKMNSEARSQFEVTEEMEDEDEQDMEL